VLNVDGFKNFLIFLAAAGVIVPFFHRAQLGTVIGFFIVGAVLGPYGIGLLVETHPWLWYVTFDDPHRAAPLAELGIIFLLFLLGLEVSMQRLWQLRRYVLGVGLAQVALTAIAIGLLLRWWGAPAPSGLVLGLCLAMSSTAVVMQLLIDQRRAATHVGRISLSVLLFQDLMVAPILFMIGILSGGAERGLGGLAVAFVQALAAVAVIMAAGRFLVRPLLHSAGRTASRDLIMAITLLIVVGISAVTHAAGLSVALGAFLAGLLLSESEYRHHIEVDLEPFKGLLLGIFFVTVGTSVDLRVVAGQAGAIVGAVAALIAVKAAVLFAVARAWRVATATAVEFALLLAQGGEFAFVVIGIARGNELLSAPLATASVAVVALSMMITPVLALLARKAGQRVETSVQEASAPLPDSAGFEDHVVIGGFGRVGQTVANLLEREGMPYVALDSDGAVVTAQRNKGRSVYFGDASRGELLRRAGAEKARAFVVTLDAPGAAERMVEAVMQIRPDARVYARAKDGRHAAKLAALGATGVIPEAVEASLQLSGRVLQGVGLPSEVVDRRLAEVRRAQDHARPQ
jgi:CPA2 family monovalent cation:H+ antiporter-2